MYYGRDEMHSLTHHTIVVVVVVITRVGFHGAPRFLERFGHGFGERRLERMVYVRESEDRKLYSSSAALVIVVGEVQTRNACIASIAHFVYRISWRVCTR